MKKMKYRIFAGAMALVLGTGSLGSLCSEASTPPFGRTEEEWAKLEDDNLEYDEIADLIHEYNPTVIGNNYDYDEWVDENGTTASDVAAEYRLQAGRLESSDTDDLLTDLSNRIRANSLRSSADNNTDDSVTTLLGYQEQEAQLVMQAKTAFATYYLRKAQYESAQVQLEMLKNTLTLTEMEVAAGTATSMDLLTAQKNVQDQEAAVKTAENAIETARQSLIIMFGWSSVDQPTIGAAPEVSVSAVDSIDLQADTDTALSNNYTIKTNQRKLYNAEYADNQEQLEKDLAANDTAVRASVSSAYKSLNNARMDLTTAETALAAEQSSAAIDQASYSAGLSTALEYSNSQLSLRSAEIAVETARLNLLTAYITYSSYVDGLADAG